MDKKGGWIKLYRSVWYNWVFDNDEPKCTFGAWVDLLLMVNHETKKVMVKGNLIEVKNGQKLTSIRKLSKRWNWGKDRTSKFLYELQNDGMIYYMSDKKTGTLITVRNYADYQGIFEGNSYTDRYTDKDTDRYTDRYSVGTQTRTQTGHKQEYKNNKNDKEGKNNKERRPWGGRLEPE